MDSAEDAATFDLGEQKVDSWVKFFGLLGTVLAGLYVVWVQPGTGVGTQYVDAFEGIVGGDAPNAEIVMLLMIAAFGAAHSGMAALRPLGERVIGERAFRVGFALVSLPLAFSTIMYFINHRYSGAMLWQVQDVPGVHTLVWILSFVSFFFLYPSTFNLLEIAAVDVPKLHLWETGVIRITRHPQMVGQVIWCAGHTLWTGNSFVLTASLALCAYHAFGVWHGDQRLRNKFGDDFEKIKATTSVWPFVAIAEGRQRLPPNYLAEFWRAPYLSVTLFTVGAYLCHPLMQRAAYWLDW